MSEVNVTAPMIGATVFWQSGHGVVRGAVHDIVGRDKFGEVRDEIVVLRVKSLFYRQDGEDIGSEIGTLFVCQPGEIFLDEASVPATQP